MPCQFRGMQTTIRRHKTRQSRTRAGAALEGCLSETHAQRPFSGTSLQKTKAVPENEPALLIHPLDSDAAATASAPNYDTSCLSSRRLWPASMPHTVSEGQPPTRFERDSEIGTPENRANLGGAGSWANSEVTASAGQYGFQKPYDSGTNHPSLQGCIYGGFLKAILPS